VDYDMEEDVRRFLAHMRGKTLCEAQLRPLLARAFEAGREEVEQEHAAKFCQRCENGEKPTHSPHDPRWLYMHQNITLPSGKRYDGGCCADWVHEIQRKRKEATRE
jgi:hypothetical protein